MIVTIRQAKGLERGPAKGLWWGPQGTQIGPRNLCAYFFFWCGLLFIMTFHILGCGVLFLHHSMVHHQKHCQTYMLISFLLKMSFRFCSYFFSLAFSLGLGFNFGPLGTFHLGFFHPHLYVPIPSILNQEVQLFFWLSFDCSAGNPFDVATWHLCLLFLHWCFLFPPCGGASSHREAKAWLRQFLTSDWEELQVKHVFWASLCSGPFFSLSPFGGCPSWSTH